jgi:serine/threonine-protein kinase SRK2
MRWEMQRIMGVKYSFPSNLHLSRECVDLISKIFQANPGNRISIAGIRVHPWFLKNLPEELVDGGRAAQVQGSPRNGLKQSAHLSSKGYQSKL